MEMVSPDFCVLCWLRLVGEEVVREARDRCREGGAREGEAVEEGAVEMIGVELEVDPETAGTNLIMKLSYKEASNANRQLATAPPVVQETAKERTRPRSVFLISQSSMINFSNSSRKSALS
jgi:hypothetical protein